MKNKIHKKKGGTEMSHDDLIKQFFEVVSSNDENEDKVKEILGALDSESKTNLVNTEEGAALRWAASQGHLKVVKVLLAAGADVHADDDYALRKAVQFGHLPVVRELVAAGADVHAKDDEAFRVAVQQNNIDMFKAILLNEDNVVKMLQSDKTDINVKKKIQQLLKVIYYINELPFAKHIIENIAINTILGGGSIYTTYKGRKYKVRSGPHGGHFILVGKDKKKIYV